MFKNPWILAGILLIIMILCYGFLETKPSDLRQSDEVRLKNLTAIGVENILLAEQNKLTEAQKAELSELETGFNQEKTDSIKSETAKKLSGFWYQKSVFALAGHYAEEVAKIEKSGESWAIAATSYIEGLDSEQKDVKDLCLKKAEEMSQNAISLEPNNPDYRLNLATAYIKYPTDNPMQGILMMRDLEKQFPDYLPVKLTLAQLSIQTGQWDKAEERLRKLIQDYPNQKDAYCLLADVLVEKGKPEEAEKVRLNCK